MSEETKNSKKLPFREGLFIEESNKAYLIGNKCESCGRIFYPSRPFCFDCSGTKMQKAKFGNKGKLYSFTICHMPSLHFEAPYTVGWIDVDEGIRIFAPIKISENQSVEVGMDMELVIDELWQEEDKSVAGYRFRPVQL